MHQESDIDSEYTSTVATDDASIDTSCDIDTSELGSNSLGKLTTTLLIKAV